MNAKSIRAVVSLPLPDQLDFAIQAGHSLAAGAISPHLI
uniref:Uncharacterized protein n=1 Tax=Arundo donax TaxID=35708 RepID=A0A0A8YT93_ARUDO